MFVDDVTYDYKPHFIFIPSSGCFYLAEKEFDLKTEHVFHFLAETTELCIDLIEVSNAWFNFGLLPQPYVLQVRLLRCSNLKFLFQDHFVRHYIQQPVFWIYEKYNHMIADAFFETKGQSILPTWKNPTELHLKKVHRRLRQWLSRKIGSIVITYLFPDPRLSQSPDEEVPSIIQCR